MAGSGSDTLRLLMPPIPSASYSLTMRIEIPSTPGAFAQVAGAIAEAQGDVGAIDLVRVTRDHTVRDITVSAADSDHGQRIVDAVRKVAGVTIVNVSDRTFLMHLGGKIAVRNKVPVKTRDDLSMAYTPGVARVCLAIADDVSKARALTIKQNTVAVVTDGTAVLGLGDIGPEAAMPVMEGKAMLFKEFAGIDAWPLALNTKDTDEIITIVKAIAPGFGGINLEDIAAPRCFEIEGRLRRELDIPVFHDDQHGTAVVVLAGLINAAKLVQKRLDELKVVLVGVGAAGVAVSKLLMEAGVQNIIGCDREGSLFAGKRGLVGIKKWYAQAHEPGLLRRRRQPGAGRRRRVPRPVRPRGGVCRCDQEHGARFDRVCHGQPDARGAAGGAGGHRPGDRHRPLGLPEPDQQRAVLPRDVPRGARLAGDDDQRGDEPGRRPGGRRRHLRGRAARGLRHPVGVQQGRGRARGRRRRRRGSPHGCSAPGAACRRATCRRSTARCNNGVRPLCYIATGSARARRRRRASTSRRGAAAPRP